MTIATTETQNQTVTLDLSNAQIEALGQATHGVSTDSTRAALTGVHLIAGHGLVAWSTNSYIGIRRQVLDESHELAPLSVVLEGKALRDACKAVAKAQRLGAQVTLSAEGAVFAFAGHVIKVPSLDYEFPNMEQLVPRSVESRDGVESIALSPHYIGLIAKALGVPTGKAGQRPGIGVKFEMIDSLKPVKISNIAAQSVGDYALLMPVRLSVCPS